MFPLCCILSVCLIVGGFLVPPMGIIDGSVLRAVGLLLAFAALAQVPEVIKAGKSVKIKSGSFSAEIEADDET
ncbi:MAG: hypothetical protein IKK87_08485 [Bacteroidaceae bacterium]|nr:hypothetical protein [Bacteroidaceae bacterium]